MKAYAISDLHGCAQTLEALISQLELGSNDHLFFLGDYVNKGPDSAGVLKLLRRYEEADVQTIFLQGNHDHLVVQAARGEIDRDTAFSAGLASTLQAFDISHPADLPTETLEWLENRPTYHRWENYWMVHAGFDFSKNNPLADTEGHRLIRNWYADLDRKWLGDQFIIHGHTQQKTMDVTRQVRDMQQDRIVNIDSGCVNVNDFGKGYLCAFDLINQTTIFQPNLDLAPPHW